MKKKWGTIVLPKADKQVRKLRYLDVKVEGGPRVFVEKLLNYNLYVVSVGKHPKAVTVAHLANDLRSAMVLAKNEVATITDGMNKVRSGR